eukprot:gene10427-11546_t
MTIQWVCYSLCFFFIIHLSFLQDGGVCQAVLSEDLILYTEIAPVDSEESLRRVKELPIVYYKFLYDSVPDRIQLGVVGPEAQRLFPESIEVLPSTVFARSHSTAASTATGGSSGGSSPSGSTASTSTSVLTNLPVVDKSVLFMHGVAAIKELITVFEQLNDTVRQLGEVDKETEKKYQTLRKNLERDISKLQNEKLLLAQEEIDLARKQLEQEKQRALMEEERLQAQLAKEQQLLEFEEKLSKERLLQQEALSKEYLAKQLELERELAQSKDLMQRRSAEVMQALKVTQSQELERQRLELEKEKIRSEIEAKTQQDRMNEEASLRKLEMQSKLDTERMVQGIKSVSSQLSTIVQDIFSRPRQIAILAAIFLVVLAAYYLIREFSTMVREFIQNRIGKPTLVRETSYHLSFWPSFLTWSYYLESSNVAEGLKCIEDTFHDVVLSTDDKERVVNLAYATRNTRRSNAPFRHVLLHGPPGTGKTLIARRLAYCSNMDYAILSGGDVAPLGEDAVNQLHALFNWANRSKRGLLVFIDEAEAFLSSRSNVLMEGASDAHLRNALNALLYQTGTPSKHFMMVLATNRPEDLDPAILDRIDVSLEIGLPRKEQRIALIRQYMSLHVTEIALSTQRRGLSRLIFGKGGGCEIENDCISTDMELLIAEKTEGFSGREISKLFISAQYAMYLSPSRLLTQSQLEKVVNEKVKEHNSKSTGFKLAPPHLFGESIGGRNEDNMSPRKLMYGK